MSAVPSPRTPALSRVKKFVKSVAAAFTTPTAIKAEKSLAVIVGTRVLLSVGASAALIDVVVKAVQNL